MTSGRTTGATPTRLFGGIEAGGTKFICGIANSNGEMLATARIPTTTPIVTLEAVAQFFESSIENFGPLAAMGIGSFGPLSLNTAAPNFGHITSTPKPGWSDVDLLGFFRQRFALPVTLDTDVNASAI